MCLKALSFETLSPVICLTATFQFPPSSHPVLSPVTFLLPNRHSNSHSYLSSFFLPSPSIDLVPCNSRQQTGRPTPVQPLSSCLWTNPPPLQHLVLLPGGSFLFLIVLSLEDTHSLAGCPLHDHLPPHTHNIAIQIPTRPCHSILMLLSRLGAA